MCPPRGTRSGNSYPVAKTSRRQWMREPSVPNAVTPVFLASRSAISTGAKIIAPRAAAALRSAIVDLRGLITKLPNDKMAACPEMPKRDRRDFLSKYKLARPAERRASCSLERSSLFRRLGAVLRKTIFDIYAAMPSSWNTPRMAARSAFGLWAPRLGLSSWAAASSGLMALSLRTTRAVIALRPAGPAS